jgi:O-antigen/teichoic acid export membrane protein
MTADGLVERRRGTVINLAYSSMGSYAEYAVLLITSVIVARRLGPGEYGVYALTMWIAAYCVAFANNGLTTGVLKFLAEARGRQDPVLAGRILAQFDRLQLFSAFGICAVFALLIAAGVDRLILPHAGVRDLLWAVLPMVALRAGSVYQFAAARGVENFRLTARVHAALAPVAIALVLAAGQLGAGVKEFIYVHAAAALVYALVMRLTLRGAITAIPGRLDELVAARIRRHTLYASGIVLLDLIVLRQTELFFLARFSTRENIAYYGLGRSLAATAMLLVPGVFAALLVPAMSRTFGEDVRLLPDRFIAATRHIFMLAIPVLVFCELFAVEIVTLLYGTKYTPAVPVFQVSAVAAAVGAISSGASSYQLGTDRQPATVRIMASVAAVTLLLDYWLIRRYGLNGAIAAGATGSLLLAVGLIWHACRTLRVSLDVSTAVRVTAAGAASAIPALLPALVLPPLLALPAGALLLVCAYPALMVWLRAWVREDLSSLRRTAATLPEFARAPVVAWLQWAEPFARASRPAHSAEI